MAIVAGHKAQHHLVDANRVIARRGLFGETCMLGRVQEELLSYSDFGLHCFALSHGPLFAKFPLGPEHLMDSAKCRALSELLQQLRVRDPQPELSLCILCNGELAANC